MADRSLSALAIILTSLPYANLSQASTMVGAEGKCANHLHSHTACFICTAYSLNLRSADASSLAFLAPKMTLSVLV